jgi:hypothetical protein
MGAIRPSGTIILTSLNPHYVRRLSCTCKFEIFWPCGSLNDLILFLHFSNYLPFEQDLALSFGSTWPIPSNLGCLTFAAIRPTVK